MQADDTYQPDLFMAVDRSATPKNSITEMELPLWSLGKRVDIKPREFSIKGVKYNIEPSRFGMPNMEDKNLLVYALGQAAAIYRSQEVLPEAITFPVWEFLHSAGKSDSVTSYKAIELAIDRLDGCRIKRRYANEAGAEVYESMGFFQKIRLVKSDIAMIEIEFTKHALASIKNHESEFLAHHTDYYKMAGLEKRAYEIARKFCGLKTSWKYNFNNPDFCTRWNPAIEPRRLKYQLKEIFGGAGKKLGEYIVRWEESDNAMYFSRFKTIAPGELD